MTKTKKRILLLLCILSGICCLHFGGSALIYEIRSRASEKKIEELIASILVPYDVPEVSEAHRQMDQMIGMKLTGTPTPIIETEPTPTDVMASEPKILYQYSVLYRRNPDMIGWISIDGTVVNYPVMQTKAEEEYYLLRDFDKGSDINGLPFMDADSDCKLPTDNLIIYAHNMKNGSMFHTLLSYENRAFYEEHPLVRFDTVYEEAEYQIIACFRTQVPYQGQEAFRYYEFQNAASEKEFDDFINAIKAISFYDTGITASYGDRLLTLSTCDRSIEEGRFVVVAKKTTRGANNEE